MVYGSWMRVPSSTVLVTVVCCACEGRGKGAPDRQSVTGGLLEVSSVHIVLGKKSTFHKKINLGSKTVLFGLNCAIFRIRTSIFRSHVIEVPYSSLL
jgi:hypothetical protein